MPKISIIIPVYNVEKYLTHCLDSIMAQSFKDFECILVNDGSNDSSGTICDEYSLKDKRFICIHKKNNGASSARNTGISNAKGDYFCFVDSDDYVDPKYLEKMYNVSIQCDTDLVFCGLMKQQDNGTFITYNPFFCDEHLSRKQFLDIFPFLRKPENNVYLHSPVCKLYSTKLYANCRFKEDVTYGEDYLFNLDVFNNINKIVFLSDNLYYYIYNGSSVSTMVQPSLKLISNNGLQIVSTIQFCKKNKVNLYAKDLLLYFFEECLHFYQRCCSIDEFNFSNNVLSKTISLNMIFKSFSFETQYLVTLLSIKTKKYSFFKKYFCHDELKNKSSVIQDKYVFIKNCLNNKELNLIDKEFVSTLTSKFLFESFLYFRLRRFFLFLFVKLRIFHFISFVFSLKKIIKK